jgi:hypothetical protein
LRFKKNQGATASRIGEVNIEPDAAADRRQPGPAGVDWKGEAGVLPARGRDAVTESESVEVSKWQCQTGKSRSQQEVEL